MDSRAWLTDYKSLPEGSVPAYAQRYGDDDHVLDCYHVIEKALSNVDLAGSIGKLFSENRLIFGVIDISDNQFISENRHHFGESTFFHENISRLSRTKKNFSRPIKIVYAVNVSKSSQVYN